MKKYRWEMRSRCCRKRRDNDESEFQCVCSTWTRPSNEGRPMSAMEKIKAYEEVKCMYNIYTIFSKYLLHWRWLKVWGVTVASESQQRKMMKAQLSEINVEAESVPFSFSRKNRGQELRPAPLAYINDLKSMVYHLLDEKDR